MSRQTTVTITDVAREAGVALGSVSNAFNHPDKMRHVVSLIRSTRGGKDYDPAWGQRQVGSGPYAWMIGRRFEMAAERLGFNSARLRLRTDLFVKPEKEKAQLSLF